MHESTQLTQEWAVYGDDVDENSPSRDAPYCPNLAVCFMQTIDFGLRSGDIADAAMDSLG